MNFVKVKTIIACCLLFLLSATVDGQSIKTTTDFITYFEGIENMRDYKVIKDSVEKLAVQIKTGNSIAAEKKVILKTYYEDVQVKSEELYNKIVADLLSKDKRKEIRGNVSGYIQSINVYFDGIKKSGTAFTEKYKEITGKTKGFFLAWIIKTFALPLVKAFVNEVINDVVRKQLDKVLKPILVIKPWATV